MPGDFDVNLPTMRRGRRGAVQPPPAFGGADDSTTHGHRGRRPTRNLALLVLLLAVVAGGVGALVFHADLGGGDSGPDAGLAGLGPVGPRDAGRPEPEAGGDVDSVPLEVPDAGPVDAGIEPVADAGTAVAAADEETGRPDTQPPDKRKKRKRTTTPRCPERGYGTLAVGVVNGWANVYIDNKMIRTTPLVNFKLKAGRHRVELRDGGGGALKRWNICLRANRSVKLIHQ